MGHTPNIVVVLAGLFCGLVEGLQGRPVCGRMERGKQKEGRKGGGEEGGKGGEERREEERKEKGSE